MYLDNAATSFPKPECVYQTLDSFLRTAGANPGRSSHHLAVAAARAIGEARLRLARLLNAPDPQRIVWTANCTGALNLALQGLLRSGDHVVTTELEHNSVIRPLHALKQRGVCVTRVTCPAGAFDLDKFVVALMPDTSLAVVTHASNVTGELLPLAEIAQACRERGIRLLVDAAQTAGPVEIDVRALGIDLLAMPGHKGLYGPPGTGALYITDGLDLAPLMFGGTGTSSESEETPERLPERFEPGTLNSGGIAALGAAIEWITSTGQAKILLHERALTERLWRGLSEVAGVELYGPPPERPRVGVLSFNLAGWEPTDLALVLDESFNIQCRPGLHCAPGAHRALGTFPAGTVRLSPGYFNTPEEMDAVIAAVRAIAGS